MQRMLPAPTSDPITHSSSGIRFTFYMDNCTVQNKNWVIFTAMTAEVNCDREGPDEIIFKYLEKGHTFMSA